MPVATMARQGILSKKVDAQSAEGAAQPSPDR
jgi:hypothetical protein